MVIVGIFMSLYECNMCMVFVSPVFTCFDIALQPFQPHEKKIYGSAHNGKTRIRVWKTQDITITKIHMQNARALLYYDNNAPTTILDVNVNLENLNTLW